VLDVVYATGTAEEAVHLAGVFGDCMATQLPCAVWPITGADNHARGLLIQVCPPTAAIPTRQAYGNTEDELRDVNKRLLIAGLVAQEQAEAQVALRAEAESALKLRDEFLSRAAHELRTPITAIKASAQLLPRAFGESISDNERAARYLRRILGGADRLVLLINDLMDVSRMHNGALLLRVAPIDLVTLVSAVALRDAEGEGEHQVRTDLPAVPVLIVGDATRLEQILDNLLGNAVKYSPGGGEIDVRLRQDASGIVLSVSDAGIGLPAGTQDRIFEPFGRAANATRQALPGMGLGLHICRQIAAAHSGRMWAESEGEGQGATIHMWLPPPQPEVWSGSRDTQAQLVRPMSARTDAA
jgi:signal transduction histidine kinase